MVALKERINQFFELQGYGLEEYLAAPKKVSEATDCFMEDLSFGTAGLRSEMDVGFNRMNEVTVKMASMGIAEYLRSEKGGRGCSIVIGYDHRNNSKLFADSAAGVFAAYGHSIAMFSKAVPTPFVASAVRSEGYDLGVMITASHNPKKDNGYKVYAGNGAQIDDSIAAEMLQHINQQRGNYKNLTIAKKDHVDCRLIDRIKIWYIGHLKAFLNPISVRESGVKVVYTALHGVGADYVDQVFEELFCEKSAMKRDKILIHVEEQRRPDPEFPTVDFPNPEEGPSTLKLAIKTASERGINFIFANDPDADRFCVAERAAGGKEWRIFNGNEIAALLADHLSKKYKIEREGEGEEQRVAMLASCVSSRFLEKFCGNRGWRFEATATGFKNLGNCGLKLKSEGWTVLLAYEEAIGFQVGDWNFDKDGISALATFYQILQDSSGLLTRLNGIYEREACWPVQCNGYYFCHPAGRIKGILAAINTEDSSLLERLNRRVKVNRFVKREGRVEMEFLLEALQGASAWLMLRSSGTEPKLKFYSELMTRERVEGAEMVLKRIIVDDLIEILIDPKANNLVKKA